MLNEALDEKYVTFIAQNRGIKVKDATILIDTCIKKLSASSNIDYNIIYKMIFSEEGLEYINSKLNIVEKTKKVTNCNKLSMKECIQSNSCFYLEPYGCLSREFPDVEIMNANPDAYIKKNLGKVEDLKKFVAIADYLYHNYDSKLSDNAYSALQHYLGKKEKIKNRALEKIGAPVIERLRINLEYPLPSLDKVKPGESKLNQYLKNFNDNVQCQWSLKLDGVSAMLTYRGGKLVSINTRGDGNIGGDVTYLRDYVTLPTNVKYELLVVRGELILSKKNWETKYNGTFSNARAFVSGKVNSGFVVSALNDIEFIAYEIMVLNNDTIVPSPSQALKILTSFNFNVVDAGIFDNQPTIFEIMELYKKKRANALYDIDGLVLKINEKRPSVPKIDSKVIYNPSYAVAFKMELEEQRRKTKVLTIEWNISRYGKYIPVVIYEAVYIQGNRLTRSTGHNIKHIADWNMGLGTNIIVSRAGDVIPQIKDVTIDKTITPIFPSKYEWHWEGHNAVLNEIDTNREVKIKRIIHFYETLGVPNLGPATIEKLYDIGYETAEDVAKAKVNDFMKIKGIGQKRAQGFYDNIRNTMQHVPLDRFIEASTAFQSGIGRVLLKTLFKEFPYIMDYDEDQIREAFKKKKIANFGPGRINNIAANIPKLRAYLDSFAKEDIKKAIHNHIKKLEEYKKNGYNNMIDGKIFVVTQMPFDTDYELEDYIYDNNGTFIKTITSNVEAVICGNMGTISKKMIRANELGVKVLFLEEFNDRYGLHLKRFENKTKHF